ncbi:3-isopropylmalate dehydratase large subunit [bacterium Unc6]|nr:3-isopropylmalate dehydratase large subunit [bacterium Unc6]
MTISEKILAKHSGKKYVKPGELILARVDFCLGNDVTAPVAINEFYHIGSKKVFNTNKIALVPDHFTPNKDIKSATQTKIIREFAKTQKIRYYFEVGRMGVEHALLPELALVGPGMLVVGADSHTCTYGAMGCFSTGVGSTDLACAMILGKVWLKVPQQIKFICKGRFKKWVGGKDLILSIIGDIGVDGALDRSMEFEGSAIEILPIEERLAMCNMAVEAGAQNGIIAPDGLTQKYLEQGLKRAKQDGFPGDTMRYFNFDLKSDENAIYEKVHQYNVDNLLPLVALPHLPSNVKPAREIKNMKIDQVIIGSCTNGRITDLRIAAKILKGKKVHKNVRLIVIPATQWTYRQANREELLDIFVDAGGAVSTPTCGPCLGGHMGILAEGERAVATTNRNFVGRMGHPKSEVILSGPAVAISSAILGRVADPEEIKR